MQVIVSFYSYLKDLTGCSRVDQEMPEKSTLDDLMRKMGERFPRLNPMWASILVAVGADYQNRAYILKNGDEISFFPPVQGG